jgi:hypothetical protein
MLPDLAVRDPPGGILIHGKHNFFYARMGIKKAPWTGSLSCKLFGYPL